MENKVVLITGATSGIGFQAAEMMASLGWRVFGAGRHVKALEPLAAKGVTAVMMDITSGDDVKRVVKEVIDAAGRIDVLVNNAGYGSLGPVEEVKPEEARRQMDVNVFGLMELTQAVLPYMRQAHSGTIINVSSIAGRVVSLMGGWYHASKYALEALSDALRREVEPFGIHVSIIEPGAIKTPWADIAARHLDESSQGTPYQEAAGRSARFMRRLYGSRWPTAPERVARVIVKAAQARHPKARYRVGFSSTSQLWLKALLPTKLFDKLVP